MTVGSPPSVEVASAVASKMALEDVVFVDVSATYLTMFGPDNLLSYEQEPTIVRIARVPSRMVAFVAFSLLIKTQTAEDDVKLDLARIRLTVKLQYAIRSDEISDDEMRSFAGVSGYMHAFPYVRSEVQALTATIGLPALTLPLVLSGEVPQLVRVDPQIQGPRASSHESKSTARNKKRSPSRKVTKRKAKA